MTLTLDLHIHSAASHDGRMTLAEIAEAAKEAGLDGVAVCDEQDFVKLYGLTGFSVTDVVYKKLFALLNLELLTINNYDCVHFCIYVFNVSPRGEFLMKLLSMSPGDKIGCKVRTFFWNDQNSLSSFFNKFQSAGDSLKYLNIV